MSAPPGTILETRALTAFYGDFQALFGIGLAIERGETAAIVGANGAGKSTFLRSVAGQLPSAPEQVTFAGEAVGHLPAHAIVRRGVALVPEGRLLFPSLSVEENLRLGAYAGRRGFWGLERVYGLFPALRERRTVPGTALSGGEQQMCAIGRALMSNPALLLCDELSLGLAPVVVRQLYAALPRIVAQGTTVVVVEQDIDRALSAADRVFCFREGLISLQGRPESLARADIARAYFGV